MMTYLTNNLLICAICMLIQGVSYAQAPTLQIPNLQVNAANQFAVPVKTVDFDSVTFFQFSIKWDKNALQFIGTQDYFRPELATNSFDTSQVQAGRLGVLWIASTGTFISIPDNTSLFSVLMKAKNASSSNVTMQFVNQPVAIEIGYSNGTTKDSSQFILQQGIVSVQGTTPQNNIITHRLQVYQNYPNPFSDYTSIPFELAKQQEVQLTIFDMAGRELWREIKQFPAGAHKFILDKHKFIHSGNYLYSLKINNAELSKQLIFVQY